MTDTTITNDTDHDERQRLHVAIQVNDHKVRLAEHEVTGAEIKAAAIAAGVPIQADFVLSRVKRNGNEKFVPDDKTIHVDKGDEFWAIPGDDNS